MTDPNSDSTGVPPVPPASAPGYTPQPTPQTNDTYSGYAQPTAQTNDTYSGYAQPTYASVPAVAPKTLSLIGMIAGIVGVVAFGWFLPASIAALILGYMGKTREGLPAKGFWMTAIITGWIGAAITVIGGIAFIAIFAIAGAGSVSY